MTLSVGKEGVKCQHTERLVHVETAYYNKVWCGVEERYLTGKELTKYREKVSTPVLSKPVRERNGLKPYNSVIQVCPVCGKLDASSDDGHDCGEEAANQENRAMNDYNGWD